MSFRSLGAKVLNNAKVIVNTQSTISHHIDNIDNNENDYESKENYINSNQVNQRRKKRQRMHFRPIIPQHYICPITQELMTEPVIISSGHTFEKSAIIEWFKDGNTINPLTGQQLQNIQVKPNYALKDAIKEYRRKLADELFRITFDQDKNKEVLYYRDNILFSNEISSSDDDDNDDDNDDNDYHYNNDDDIDNDELIKDDHHINEYDGYITDDEEEENISNISNISLSKKKKKHKLKVNICKHKNKHKRNIPIIAFMGPNSTGKSTLLNLIVGEPVFITCDELSDYDTLSKVVRFKIVTRADREFILLDVEGLFPDPNNKQYPDINISDAVLKIFFAVYSIASVIVWNDTNENNPLLKNLLHRSDDMMHDINHDGDNYFRPFGYHINELFGETPSGSLLPQELRQFLMKKYKKLTKKQENKKDNINIGTMTTHKPGFVILRRDYDNNNYLLDNNLKWLQELSLFSFIDGVCLQKLNEIYQDDSLLSILPKLDNWINNWCQKTINVIPIVRNNDDMLSVIKCINKYNVISSIKYVEDEMEIKGSRLKRYFYYDNKERTLNELKLIAERFKWDQKNLIRWFQKHFNRLWYATKDFPNAHYALLYQALFYQYYLNNNNNNNTPIIPIIILNLSHFYYQISNKIDLYKDIVDKSAGWGQFAGASLGLGSLSLMSVIHPLVGIAAVPFSIHFGQQLGANSGAKVGDAIAYSKAHYVDQTERYDLGQINDNDNDNHNDNHNDIVYKSCYDSDSNDKNKDKEDDNDSKTN